MQYNTGIKMPRSFKIPRPAIKRGPSEKTIPPAVYHPTTFFFETVELIGMDGFISSTVVVFWPEEEEW